MTNEANELVMDQSADMVKVTIEYSDGSTHTLDNLNEGENHIVVGVVTFEETNVNTKMHVESGHLGAWAIIQALEEKYPKEEAMQAAIGRILGRLADI